MIEHWKPARQTVFNLIQIPSKTTQDLGTQVACAIACFRLSDGRNDALVKGTRKYERVCRRDYLRGWNRPPAPQMEIDFRLSLSTKQHQHPCSGPPYHLRTRIWVRAVIGLLKKLWSICQSGWREIWNAFLVIHWFIVHWEPRTRIWALLHRHY